MILHLNQQSFQKFGTILPERQQSHGLSDRSGLHQKLCLERGAATVYRTQCDCFVYAPPGTAYLSVAQEQEQYSHFYLDKPLCLHPGVCFSLAPIGSQAQVELIAAEPPLAVGQRRAEDDFLIRPRLQPSALYTLFYHEKERGFFFPGEAHPMLELTYVDQGVVHSVADGKDLRLEQGDLVLYGPNQWHMQYAEIGDAPRYMTVSFDASGSIPDSLFNQKRKAPQAALGLLNQMLREQEHPDIHSEDMILSLLGQLLILLQREADSDPAKLRTAYSVHNENEIIRRAQQYICKHVRQKLTVPLVARQVDVSPSYLTALFHKHLKLAPGEYIRRIKLQESKQLIRENTMNFTEIAAALQYSTVHHFSRQFKEKFGITPSEYAKSVR